MYSSDDSEFDDEADDEELKLYSKLYFEDSLITKCSNEQTNVLTSQHCALVAQDTYESKRNSTSNLSCDINGAGSSMVKVVENNLKSVQIPAINCITKNYNAVDKQPKYSGRVRRRNYSICSTDSISGKEPLDNLYCLDTSDDDDELPPIPELSEDEDDSINPINSYCDEESRYNLFSKQKDSELLLTRNCHSSESSNNKSTLNQCLSLESLDLEFVKEVSNKKQNTLKWARKNSLPNPVITLSGDSSSDSEKDYDKAASSSTPLILNVKNFNSGYTSQRQRCKPYKSQVNFSKLRSPSNRIPSCEKWTKEMTSFYDSDISDDFSVEEIHSAQSDSKRNWKICSDDFPVRRFRSQRYYEVRCTRCREFGHGVTKCPRVPHCIYCSSTQHVKVYDCPKNICLRCGLQPHAYCTLTEFKTKCSECGSLGHDATLCPDLWRRFHCTVEGNVPVKPKNVNTQAINLRKNPPYCYNCTRKGHFGHECRASNAKRYKLPITEVLDYSPPPMNDSNSLPEISPRKKAKLTDSSPEIGKKVINFSLKKIKTLMQYKRILLDEIQRRSEATVAVLIGTKISNVIIYGTPNSRKEATRLLTVILTKSPEEEFKDLMSLIKAKKEEKRQWKTSEKDSSLSNSPRTNHMVTPKAESTIPTVTIEDSDEEKNPDFLADSLPVKLLLEKDSNTSNVEKNIPFDLLASNNEIEIMENFNEKETFKMITKTNSPLSGKRSKVDENLPINSFKSENDCELNTMNAELKEKETHKIKKTNSPLSGKRAKVDENLPVKSFKSENEGELRTMNAELKEKETHKIKKTNSPLIGKRSKVDENLPINSFKSENDCELNTMNAELKEKESHKIMKIDSTCSGNSSSVIYDEKAIPLTELIDKDTKLCKNENASQIPLNSAIKCSNEENLQFSDQSICPHSQDFKLNSNLTNVTSNNTSITTPALKADSKSGINDYCSFKAFFDASSKKEIIRWRKSLMQGKKLTSRLNHFPYPFPLERSRALQVLTCLLTIPEEWECPLNRLCLLKNLSSHFTRGYFNRKRSTFYKKFQELANVVYSSCNVGSKSEYVERLHTLLNRMKKSRARFISVKLREQISNIYEEIVNPSADNLRHLLESAEAEIETLIMNKSNQIQNKAETSVNHHNMVVESTKSNTNNNTSLIRANAKQSQSVIGKPGQYIKSKSSSKPKAKLLDLRPKIIKGREIKINEKKFLDLKNKAGKKKKSQEIRMDSSGNELKNKQRNVKTKRSNIDESPTQTPNATGVRLQNEIQRNEICQTVENNYGEIHETNSNENGNQIIVKQKKKKKKKDKTKNKSKSKSANKHKNAETSRN